MDGRVTEHFSGIGFKRLVGVECIGVGISNQHEIGSSAKMRAFLGDERRTFGCTYFRFSDELTATGEFLQVEESWITYYDSREFDPKRSAEFRLTYPAKNKVMEAARPGDYCWLLQLASDPNELLLIVAVDGSAVARQLDRLLGTGMRHDITPLPSQVLKVGDLDSADDEGLSIDDMALLALIDVPVVNRFASELDRVIERFGGAGEMPKVRPFCDFVRDLCPTTDDHTDIDTALHQWFIFTDEMFRGLEDHVVSPIVNERFANQPRIDLNEFFQVALQFQQSRFSRAGYSWEFHLDAAFKREGVRFIHNRRKLADGTKPDFLFPSQELYSNEAVDKNLLTFVGAKTSTKERWMQLVAEGGRTGERFLATMDRDLNLEVLTAMAHQNVIPVLPKSHMTEHYATSYTQVLSFAELMDIVKGREVQLRAQGLLT